MTMAHEMLEMVLSDSIGPGDNNDRGKSHVFPFMRLPYELQSLVMRFASEGVDRTLSWSPERRWRTKILCVSFRFHKLLIPFLYRQVYFWLGTLTSPALAETLCTLPEYAQHVRAIFISTRLAEERRWEPELRCKPSKFRKRMLISFWKVLRRPLNSWTLRSHRSIRAPSMIS